MNTSTKNLMFLLGAAPMGMAGCLGDGIGDTLDTLTGATLSTTLTTTATTNETGEAGDGDGDGDSGDGDGTPGDGDGTPGDGDGDGDGDGAPGDGDGDGDGDGAPGDGDGDLGPIGQYCTDYANLIGQCYGAMYVDMAYMYCVQYYQSAVDFGPACADAYEAWIVCLSGLMCGDFMMDPLPGCEQATADYQAACQ